MKKILFLNSLLLTLIACNSFPVSNKKENNEKFDYMLQENWHFIAGHMQSPINIKTNQIITDKDIKPIEINYNKYIKKIENDGNTIKIYANENANSIINGRKFYLKQFHFHSPSEHEINNSRFPLEIHFVNLEIDGRIAVIAVLAKIGKTNIGFEELLNDIKNKSNTNSYIKDINRLFPKDKSYYHYLGGLTTPPLSENVEWYILKYPIEISQQQLNDFHKYYYHNNREIQPLDERTVIEYNEK